MHTRRCHGAPRRPYGVLAPAGHPAGTARPPRGERPWEYEKVWAALPWTETGPVLVTYGVNAPHARRQRRLGMTLELAGGELVSEAHVTLVPQSPPTVREINPTPKKLPIRQAWSTLHDRPRGQRSHDKDGRPVRRVIPSRAAESPLGLQNVFLGRVSRARTTRAGRR